MQIVIDFNEKRANSRVFILRHWHLAALVLTVIAVSAGFAVFGAYQFARYWVTNGDERVAMFALEAVKENDQEKRQLWTANIDSLQQSIAGFNTRLLDLNRRGALIADKLGLTPDGAVFAVDEKLLCSVAETDEGASESTEAGEGEKSDEKDAEKAAEKTAEKTVSETQVSQTQASKTLNRQSLVLQELEKKYALLSDQSVRRVVLQETIPMVRPVLGKNWLASRYGYRRDPFSGRRAFHAGYDYAARAGTPVIAAASGIVIYAGRRGNYGKSVEVYHGNGISSLYGHLSAYNVENWQYVNRGEVIAEVGSTGRSTGAHLHYEVRLNSRPRPVQKTINDLIKSRRVS